MLNGLTVERVYADTVVWLRHQLPWHVTSAPEKSIYFKILIIQCEGEMFSSAGKDLKLDFFIKWNKTTTKPNHDASMATSEAQVQGLGCHCGPKAFHLVGKAPGFYLGFYKWRKWDSYHFFWNTTYFSNEATYCQKYRQTTATL